MSKKEEKVITAYKGFNQEKWKPVVGYEENYMVSNYGRIKSIKRVVLSGRSYGKRILKERILNPVTDKDGYFIIFLSKQGNRKPFRVHRIVAQAFIENTQNLSLVNHKNMNKKDNRVDNLEWCTIYYNNHYGIGYKDRMKDYRKKVIQRDLLGNIIKEHESLSSAAISVNGNRNTISRYCRNNIKRSLYGSTWSFI